MDQQFLQTAYGQLKEFARAVYDTDTDVATNVMEQRGDEKLSFIKSSKANVLVSQEFGFHLMKLKQHSDEIYTIIMGSEQRIKDCLDEFERQHTTDVSDI